MRCPLQKNLRRNEGNDMKKGYAKMEKMIKDDKKEKGLKEGSKKDMKKDALMIAVMVGKPKAKGGKKK